MPGALDTVASRIEAHLETTRSRGVVSVYLFGSHAAGRAHRESDVDIAVLLDRQAFPTPAARFDERLRLATELGPLIESTRLDLVVLNDLPPGFGARIVTEGRRLYCADADADHAFRRDAQLRRADVAPFLRRLRPVKLAAIAR